MAGDEQPLRDLRIAVALGNEAGDLELGAREAVPAGERSRGLTAARSSDAVLSQGCPHSRDPKSPRAGTGNAPQGTIQDEHPEDAKLSNEPGTLAMANTGRPNSGSCQFFINTVHNAYLDWFSPGPSKHPVFGKITSGLDVVKKIETTPTGDRDKPKTPVKMNKVTITEG